MKKSDEVLASFEKNGCLHRKFGGSRIVSGLRNVGETEKDTGIGAVLTNSASCKSRDRESHPSNDSLRQKSEGELEKEVHLLKETAAETLAPDLRPVGRLGMVDRGCGPRHAILKPYC